MARCYLTQASLRARSTPHTPIQPHNLIALYMACFAVGFIRGASVFAIPSFDFGTCDAMNNYEGELLFDDAEIRSGMSGD